VSGLFADAELTRDAFLGGRLSLLQPRDGYRAGTDPVLLAAFVPARPGETVLDLGCGAGTAALCLAARVPGLDLHGLELQPAYAGLARRNAADNGITLHVHEGDLRAMPKELRALAFDHVLSNPPFHTDATPSRDAGRAVAHHEAGGGLADWIAAGLRRLRPGGTLALVQRIERLPEALGGLAGRAGAVEVLPLVPRAGRPAGRFLLRARKGSRRPFVLHAPLVLHDGSMHLADGDDYSAAARAVLRDLGALLPEAERPGPVA
jgi:tRNA1Val (adenine37-N6)-methyltransferase